MTLAVPKLDDRRFQDIVDEAKKRIPHYCKEWTDHNLSDPGVTLIELFAWMTDIILYRLNQVPDLHYIKFMEMLGITLAEPEPASVPVTFWLSAPQPTAVTIPAGTEVASTQTETERPIVFTTDADFRVEPPRLVAVIRGLTTDEGGKPSFKSQNLRSLEAGFRGFGVFSERPRVDDALYFGFENDLSHHVLRFDMEFDNAYGAGVDPNMPPYVFEATTGTEDTNWEACDVEQDSTQGMNNVGHIQVHLPRMDKVRVHNKTHYWVRARVKEITSAEKQDGMHPYETSPRLRKLAAASWGGTVPSTHVRQVVREALGQSDGTAGQRFQLRWTPLQKREADECLTVLVEGQPPQTWKEVTDFASSGAYDPHYTLDSISGELRLGPAVREPDGTVKLYGAIPPRGANLVFAKYRYGGGQEGNVRAGILNTLKTSIPYVARVENRVSARGGLDPESLEAAMNRAPAVLRSKDRAVTEADYEFLAQQRFSAEIGRVKCLQPRPSESGLVYVLVIPRIPQPGGYLGPDQLKVSEEVRAALEDYLDERRLLTSQLIIKKPQLHWVSVRVELRAAPGAERSTVEAEVLARLYRFLNPITGGADGKGWPFGRELYVSDVHQCLQGTPDVQFIRGLEMYAADPDRGGEPKGNALSEINVVEHGVVASGNHRVKFV